MPQVDILVNSRGSSLSPQSHDATDLVRYFDRFVADRHWKQPHVGRLYPRVSGIGRLGLALRWVDRRLAFFAISEEEGRNMNEDNVKGKLNDVKGRAERQAG